MYIFIYISFLYDKMEERDRALPGVGSIIEFLGFGNEQVKREKCLVQKKEENVSLSRQRR